MLLVAMPLRARQRVSGSFFINTTCQGRERGEDERHDQLRGGKEDSGSPAVSLY